MNSLFTSDSEETTKFSSKLIKLFKSNARSEYYYIGHDDFFVFFSGKSLKICSRSSARCLRVKQH